MDYLQDISVWAGKTSLQAGLLATTLWLIYTLRKTKGLLGIQYLLGMLIIARLCLPTTPSLTAHPMNWFSTPQTLSPSEPQQNQHRSQTVVPQNLPNSKQSALPLSSIEIQESSPASPAISWAQLFSWFWTFGCAIGLARVAHAHRRHRALLKTCHPLTDLSLETMVDRIRLTLGIRQPIELLTSSQVGTAAVTGTYRPRLIVSPSFLKQLNEQQRTHVLMHELVHIKRFDPLINWISLVLQAFHWFNPMIHWALRKFQQDRELICDAIAIKTLGEPQRKAYGETLIEILMSFKDQRSFPSLVPIISNKHEIKRRIMMISMNHSTPSRRPFLLLAGIATVLAFTFTRPALVTAQSTAKEKNTFTTSDLGAAEVTISLEYSGADSEGSTTIKLKDVASRGSGQGVLVAPGKGKQMYNVHEIDVTAFPSGGILLIDVTMGQGESAGSFDLFPEGVPLPAGAPEGSVARAYDVSPGDSRTMVYRFAKGEVLRFGASGNWFSKKGATNEFEFEARAVPLNASLESVATFSTGNRVHFANSVTRTGSPDIATATLSLDPEVQSSVTIAHESGEVLELVPDSNFTIINTQSTQKSPEKARATLNLNNALSVDVKPKGKVNTYRFVPKGKSKEVEGIIYYEFDTKKAESDKPAVSN